MSTRSVAICICFTLIVIINVSKTKSKAKPRDFQDSDLYAESNSRKYLGIKIKNSEKVRYAKLIKNNNIV